MDPRYGTQLHITEFRRMGVGENKTKIVPHFDGLKNVLVMGLTVTLSRRGLWFVCQRSTNLTVLSVKNMNDTG